MAIDMILQGKGEIISFPVNPDHLQISTSNNHRKTEIVGLGEIIVPGGKQLSTFEVSSVFPNEPFHGFNEKTLSKPQEYIDVINRMQNYKTPLRFTAVGLNIDMSVLIESFSYDVKAGEDEDKYFVLKFIEYREYGAKKIEIDESSTFARETFSGDISSSESSIPVTVEVAPPPPSRMDNKPPAPQTHEIKEGDSLWGIAKQYSKQGNEDWQGIYNIPENKKIIGSRTNNLSVGNFLVLPESM